MKMRWQKPDHQARACPHAKAVQLAGPAGEVCGFILERDTPGLSSTQGAGAQPSLIQLPCIISTASGPTPKQSAKLLRGALALRTASTAAY